MTGIEPAHRPGVPGYRITGILGVGAGGPVWSGERLADARAVAIKVIRPRPASGDVELAALRAIRHPHVVRLLEDVRLADQSVALVLDLIGGGSLGQVVAARGHLTPPETVTILTVLGTTLADLHRLGLAHGDLSPGNVLFHPDGRPVVSDLGFARIAAPAARPVMGTSGFIDPVVVGGRAPGPASDVYALGAIGWHCLTGSPPVLPGLGPRGDPDWLAAGAGRSAPPDLVELIQRALDPDPRLRPDPAEVAYAAYQSCPPGPISLASGPAESQALTRRVVRLESPAPTASGRRRRVLARLSRWRDRRAPLDRAANRAG